MDSNASPVLFWQPGTASDYAITLSELGSQADAMDAISADYARWVNRAMNWEKGRAAFGAAVEEKLPRLDSNQQPFG